MEVSVLCPEMPATVRRLFLPRLMCSDVDVPQNETRGRKERKKERKTVEGEPFGYKVASFDNLIRDQDRMIGRG